MDITDLVSDAFDRVRDAVHRVTTDLSPEALSMRPDADANSIAWLVWHLTRIQDDHVAGLAGREQVWTSDGWYERYALPFPKSATGYGHSSDEVAAVRVASSELLLAYYDAVHDQTLAYVRTLSHDDFDTVIDESWDPPVTLGVRLTSVIADDLQHVGQAAYVRGLAKRQID
jgi:uncharacterized damage-inducible protein DinB